MPGYINADRLICTDKDSQKKLTETRHNLFMHAAALYTIIPVLSLAIILVYVPAKKTIIASLFLSLWT